MADNSRLEDLRRRVQKDPASIAFAQLAEEYRRAGQSQEAVDVCRAGLALHPGYLSARVTLGRALLELNELADARTELEQVLKSAPENLAAIRGLAEIFHKTGDLEQALAQYRAALILAKNDPDLEQTVGELTSELASKAPAKAPAAVAAPEAAPPVVVNTRGEASAVTENRRDSPRAVEAAAQEAPAASRATDAEKETAARTVAALEQFLTAVHVARPDRVA